MLLYIILTISWAHKLKSLSDFFSLLKANYIIAFAITISFSSAASIPPFIGFYQKVYILDVLVDNDQLFLTLFLILSSFLPTFYYIRILHVIFFVEKSKWFFLTPIKPIFALILWFVLGLQFSLWILPSIVFYGLF